MKAQLFLLPLAAAVSAAPAHAEKYLTVEQAQALLFPGATFERDFIQLSEAQYDAIRDTAQVTQWVRQLKVWRVSTGGWFLVDNVLGRNDMISYGIGLTADGQVIGIEIIECLAEWDQIRNANWRRQVRGVRRANYQPLAVQTISGTTLSSEHIAFGVKRVLVIHDQLLKNRR